MTPRSHHVRFNKKKKVNPWTIYLFFLFSSLLFLLFVGLGVWQIYRLGWKTNLINEIMKRPLYPVVRITQAKDIINQGDSLIYRRLSLVNATLDLTILEPVLRQEVIKDPSGNSDYDKSNIGFAFLSPAYIQDTINHTEIIFWVEHSLAPFKGQEKDFQDFLRHEREKIKTINNTIVHHNTIEGEARPVFNVPFFAKPQDDKGVWFTPIPKKLSQFVQANQMLPANKNNIITENNFWLDATGINQDPSTLPLPPNNHKQYIITWFMLAFIWLMFCVVKIKSFYQP